MRARTAIILHSKEIAVVRWLRLSAIEIGGENVPKSGWSLPAFNSMKRWGQGGLREDDRGPPISLVIRRSSALDGNLRVHSLGPNTPPSPRIRQSGICKRAGCGSQKCSSVEKEAEGEKRNKAVHDVHQHAHYSHDVSFFHLRWRV